MKELQELADMTSENHPSRQGALKEINNLKAFYKVKLGQMAKKNDISIDIFNKMKLGTFGDFMGEGE